MALIFDANRAGDFFHRPDLPIHRLLLAWMTKGGANRLAVGGRLYEELMRNGRFAELLEELIRSGKAGRFSDEAVNEREAMLRDKGALASDDPHVIALAWVSGARLLFTDDDPLKEDFKNPKLLPKPRGKILAWPRDHGSQRHKFSENAARKLLDEVPPCRPLPPRASR